MELLTRASELAEFFHGQLSVIRALPAHGTPGDEAVLKRTREMADALHAQIAAKGVKASVHLMEGNPGEVVRQVAEEIEDADLIVAGRGTWRSPWAICGHTPTKSSGTRPAP